MDNQTNGVFAINLLKRLYGKGDKGTFVSPMSVSVGMGMALAGAEGKTAEEMVAVLFPGVSNPADVHDFFAAIADVLNPTAAFILHSANRLYAQKDMDFKKDFLHICANKYQNALAQVDFKTAEELEKAADGMNQWVERMTKGQIKNIVSSAGLSTLTRLILVNAMYFKGTWVHQFSRDATRSETFYQNGDQEAMVDMMRHEKPKDLNYTENESVQVLRLPYQGRTRTGLSAEMVIILPKRRCGLKEWLDKSSGSDVMTLMGDCRDHPVLVTMPKWRMEVATELGSELADMGMPSAFNHVSAEFGGMADLASLADLPPESRNIYIHKVLQKAIVEVNEEGTVAASATAMPGGLFGGGPRFIVFKANHPFLYLIATGPHILFAGVFQVKKGNEAAAVKPGGSFFGSPQFM